MNRAEMKGILNEFVVAFLIKIGLAGQLNVDAFYPGRLIWEAFRFAGHFNIELLNFDVGSWTVNQRCCTGTQAGTNRAKQVLNRIGTGIRASKLGWLVGNNWWTPAVLIVCEPTSRKVE